MSNILIEANNITKVYDPDIFLKRGKNIYALDNVNFVLDEGDFICIMGPSGSGKAHFLIVYLHLIKYQVEVSES